MNNRIRVLQKHLSRSDRMAPSRLDRVTMNLCAMNMLYESIAKRGSLMVVPSGLADSLNLPGIMGMAGAAGLSPHVDDIAAPLDRDAASRVSGAKVRSGDASGEDSESAGEPSD